jgi:hypothetical protein
MKGIAESFGTLKVAQTCLGVKWFPAFFCKDLWHREGAGKDQHGSQVAGQHEAILPLSGMEVRFTYPKTCRPI